ncbi:hypothetical protein LTSERUB_0585, partial [Salmonella enterica subsp. enterica serovar Rubislaw str. A4-653]
MIRLLAFYHLFYHYPHYRHLCRIYILSYLYS